MYSVPPPLPKKPPPLPPKLYAHGRATLNLRTDPTANICGYCTSNSSSNIPAGGDLNSSSHHRRPIVPVHPYNGHTESQFFIHADPADLKDQCLKITVDAAGVKKQTISPKPPVPPKPIRVTMKGDQTDSSFADDVIIRSVKQNAVSPRTGLLLHDDLETVRRSRLIADRSGDTGLSDLLLAQHQSGVQLISSVFDRRLKVTDNEEEDRSDHHPKTTTTIDPRRLSIRSDRSINLEDEKRELVKSLSAKLTVLEQALRDVQDETALNEQLGAQVWLVLDQCHEFQCNQQQQLDGRDLYRLHVQDVEKITRLLLKLSAQLARVENELTGSTAQQDQSVQTKLDQRRQRLAEQLQDAKILKQDLDRRGERLGDNLAKFFPQEIVEDFQYFVTMRSQLLLDAMELQDKIRLGSDQKQALMDSLA